MGTRIHKDIGYFMTKAQASELLKKNYQEILEECQQESFFESALQIAQGLNDDRHDVFTIRLQLETMRKKEKKSPRIHELIGEVFFFDTYKGLLFRNESMIQESRYDSAIDYYETGSMKNRIQYLNRGIYPYDGYYYVGGDQVNFQQLEVGKRYYPSEFMGLLVHLDPTGKNRKAADTQAKLIIQSGFFQVAVDPLMYVMARAAGILKENTNKQTFFKALQPAIVTSWG